MSTASMNTTALRHDEANAPLTALIGAVASGSWDRPSPCDGWTTRDVVAHIVDTQREFLTSRGLDVGERPDLDDPAAGWREHTARVAALLTDDELVVAPYEGYFGPTTLGATFEQFYIWDLLVHRWDIAQGAGIPVSFTDAELDRIEAGANSFGDSLYMDGVCKPGAEAGSDDRQERVLARLGRRAK
ncbi:maleylpyruvate isomerase family mycothiol-dependent enzyme [Rhodococcus sp. F64268]|uniref:maleylpyruvate isomerase family mycothiol-dependent enzyme n=1 Tax=Rhodococcus sp. F64268 TaxID=2926402 RepID=UPI001FF430FF|nr:maleylpyruvate isomerase family mycothiol-dependent enzyme [Rhodococcus sp. F64268]MCK0092600.1 maleylpyruvate isomerase family mycothiol-dependent enzyme [Rhodococcus sp. F64268]